MYTQASAVPESSDPTWNLLWLYIPDYLNNGQMTTITEIPLHLSDTTRLVNMSWGDMKVFALSMGLTEDKWFNVDEWIQLLEDALTNHRGDEKETGKGFNDEEIELLEALITA